MQAEPMTLKRRLIGVVGLCTSLGLVVWLSVNWHKARRVSETSLVTMDGLRLSSVFEGSRRDPRYDLKNIPRYSRTVIRCPAQTRTWLDKVTAFLDPSAYASANCPTTLCGGQNYDPRALTCTSSSGCQGTFQSAVYNP